MTGAELELIGKELYGRRWKAPLALRLKINRITIWRYSKLQEIPERTAIAVKHIREASQKKQ
jgi:hypothetical protein